MENKENEPTQKNEPTEKLVVQPTSEKPRRSVLKEFDPFAPDSPFVAKKNSKTRENLIQEQEIYEDAETSLINAELKNSDKTLNVLEIFLQAPSFEDFPHNLNDTADLSYVEAVENISQIDDAPVNDKTSSEDDFEFNAKKTIITYESVELNSGNKLLDITTDVNKTPGVNKDNVVVDSLEITETQINSETGNNDTSANLNQTVSVGTVEHASETIIQETETHTNNNIELQNIRNLDQFEEAAKANHISESVPSIFTSGSKEMNETQSKPEIPESQSVSLQDIGIDYFAVESTGDGGLNSTFTSPDVQTGVNNSTFFAEELEAESSKTMAQSLNQTVDLEEPVIVDDDTIKSPDNDFSRIYMRQDTLEFERLEKEFEDSRTAVHNDKKKKCEENIEIQNKSRVATGEQDTVVFEKNIAESTVPSTVRNESSELTAENNERVDADEKIEDMEIQSTSKGVISLQDEVIKERNEVELTLKNEPSEWIGGNDETANVNVKIVSEFIDKIETSVLTPKSEPKVNDMESGINESSEKAVVENMNGTVSRNPDLVLIKDSGNLCNSIVTQVDQAVVSEPEANVISDLDSELMLNPPVINYKKEEITISNVMVENSENITEPVIQDNVIINEEPEVSNSVTKLKSRVECRPNIRAIRNKTQIIDTPLILNNIDSSPSASDKTSSDQEFILYKTKSEELKNRVDKLQEELDAAKKESSEKDKHILSCELSLDAVKEISNTYKKVLAEYDQVIANRCEELRRLKEESERNIRHFTSSEMAFADVFEKYQRAKATIEGYRENEEILQSNLQSAEAQLADVKAKYSLMKEKFTEQFQKAQEQTNLEKEKYRQDIVKLQGLVKRLEIRASSLETSLKLKTEECQQLAALCDDLTGKPM